jgi:hypothetical protein
MARLLTAIQNGILKLIKLNTFFLYYCIIVYSISETTIIPKEIYYEKKMQILVASYGFCRFVWITIKRQ